MSSGFQSPCFEILRKNWVEAAMQSQGTKTGKTWEGGIILRGQDEALPVWLALRRP